MNKRILILALSLVLVATAVVSGTLAWLTDSTGPVTNTFSPANIDIDLTETFNAKSSASATANDCWKADLIPGYTYLKDPTVSVEDDSVDCYLFVKFEEVNSPSTYLTYTSTLTAANGWTQGAGETVTAGDGAGVPTNVWFRKVMATDTDREWQLLANLNTTQGGAEYNVQIKDTVTSSNMTTAASAKLVYTAYATQLYKTNGVEFTPAEAWTNAPKS